VTDRKPSQEFLALSVSAREPEPQMVADSYASSDTTRVRKKKISKLEEKLRNYAVKDLVSSQIDFLEGAWKKMLYHYLRDKQNETKQTLENFVHQGQEDLRESYLRKLLDSNLTFLSTAFKRSRDHSINLAASQTQTSLLKKNAMTRIADANTTLTLMAFHSLKNLTALQKTQTQLSQALLSQAARKNLAITLTSGISRTLQNFFTQIKQHCFLSLLSETQQTQISNNKKKDCINGLLTST
jgi:hypothetical protein